MKNKSSNGLLDVLTLDIRFSDLSKKYQLILTITSLLIVVSVGFSLILPRMTRDLLVNEFMAAQNLSVDVTATNIAFPLTMSGNVTDDVSDFESATRHLSTLSNFTHLFIYDTTGANIYRKIRSNTLSQVQLFRPRNDIKSYMEPALELYVINKDVIDIDDVKVGTITCVFSTSRLNKSISSTQYGIITVCFSVLLIGILLTIFISNLISNPLSTLLAVFKKIANGDLSIRANINTNEEFGQLARTFNRMVDNLEESYFELAETNKNMEMKIEQRTQQLRTQIEVRTQAEEKLKTTNKMVFSIINTSPLPIITLSIDFKVKSASPAFTQIFKYEEYEVIDRVLPFVTLTDIDTLIYKLQSLDEPNQTERIIVQGRKKDGRLLDLNITAVSEFDDNNEKFGYIMVVDDITERLLAEKALKESEIKYRSLIEDSIVGIGIIKDNHFVFANAALLSIWECNNLSEFLSISFIELVSINDKDHILELLNSSFSNRVIALENTELEIKIICFDGKEKYVQMASNVLELETDILLQITFVDITARKVAETEMKKLNEELEARVVDRTSKLNKTLVDLRNEMSQRVRLSKELQFKSEILELTTSFCVVFNKKGEVIYISPYSLSMLGWEDTNLLGMAFWEKLTPKILGGENLTINSVVDALANTELLGKSYVLELNAKGGIMKYLRLSNSLGQGNTLIMAGAEITEQVAAQRALEEMGERLSKSLEGEKELNDLKTRFISMVSHEFRTPLTVILNCASVIEQAFENNRVDIGMQYLDKINKSVKTMNELMEDVLIIGKSQTSKVKEIKEVDFIDFVKNSLIDIQEAYNFTSQAILEVKNDCKPFYSDESALKHIVHNLITNALKYTTNGKDVHITIDKQDDNIIYAVADEGIGIPEDDLKRLFTNFFRAKNVGKIQGTGLGLNIVKQSVDNLFGEISVKSVVNGGTTFTVKLPMDIRNKVAMLENNDD
jgi:PAS domain S-box-containing protein